MTLESDRGIEPNHNHNRNSYKPANSTHLREEQ